MEIGERLVKAHIFNKLIDNIDRTGTGDAEEYLIYYFPQYILNAER